jgi:hypothetical protein
MFAKHVSKGDAVKCRPNESIAAKIIRAENRMPTQGLSIVLVL